MKINSANSTNFQAITYRPGCQKYVAEYLTSRDKGVLRRAERAMSRCRKWDLEITITRHLKLKCLTLKIKNFKFAFNLRKNF